MPGIIKLIYNQLNDNKEMKRIKINIFQILKEIITEMCKLCKCRNI